MSCTREDLRRTGRGDAELDGATGVKLGNFFKRVAYCGEERLSRSAFWGAVPREESAVALAWNCPILPDPLLWSAEVACPSGRRCSTRNAVWCNSHPGFKSLRYRV